MKNLRYSSSGAAPAFLGQPFFETDRGDTTAARSSMAQSPNASASFFRRSLFVKGAALLVWFALAASAAAVPTIWSGLSLSFTRPPEGPSTDPVNQDRITDHVWLTRDSLEGIYNIKQET